MGRLFFLFGFLIFWDTAPAQQALEQKLVADVQAATSGLNRLEKLGRLSEFYYTCRADKKGDSVLSLQLVEAELSNDKNIILRTLFSDAINDLPSFSSTETFERATTFLQRGLDYARETNQRPYEATARIRKASLLRKRGKFEEAIQEVTLAFPLLPKDDSLKAVLYLELGDNFLGKGDAVGACTHFNSAFDIAYSLKNFPLQSETYHHYADLYAFLKNKELAKINLLESLALNSAHHLPEGRLRDYIDLARITDERPYFDKAIALADSLNLLRYQLWSKRNLFYYIMTVTKNSTSTLNYLNANPDLKQSFLNQGEYRYYWIIGNAYRYGNRPDSALPYYLKVVPLVMNAFDNKNKYDILTEMGACYAEVNQPEKAISYLENALAVGQGQSTLDGNVAIAEKLARLYAQMGDYRQAYAYNRQQIALKDSLNSLSKEREIALLDVDRVNKKHETDLNEAAANELKKRNLQYTGISVLVTVMFIVLLLTGMFPTSKVTIGMLNFVTFICFFEFITLLIDNWVHLLTRDEPLRIWLAKIVVIFALLPLHHSAEKLALKFLSSQRLKRFRERLSVRRFFRPTKKSIRHMEENLEEGTLV